MNNVQYFKVECTAKDKERDFTFNVHVLATNETTAKYKGITVGYKKYPHLTHIWGHNVTAVNNTGDNNGSK